MASARQKGKAVITEEMITEGVRVMLEVALEEEKKMMGTGAGLRGQDGRGGAGGSGDEDEEEKELEVDFDKVADLRLGFRNICKISDLNGFEQLTRLALDNNIITEITGLDHLVNLKWLDLSFNGIEEIKGLDTLVHLEDLTLFSNKITAVEGLGGCKKLNCLSIGNNDIKHTDDCILYLRQLPDLRMLNLKGNPLTADPDYRMFTIAHLSHLQYLDYSLVELKELVTAKETYQDTLMDLEEKEGMAKARQQGEEAKAKLLADLAEANLDIVETLFEDMFADDTEQSKLRQLPGLLELKEDYEEKVKDELEAFKEKALAKHQGRLDEKADFERTLARLVSSSDEQLAAMTGAFDRRMKHMFRDYEKDPDELLAREEEGGGGGSGGFLTTLLEDNDKLMKDLLAVEVGHLDQFEKLITTFEIRYTDVKTAMLELQQTYFRTIESYEESYKAACQGHAIELVGKLNAGLLDDLPPETKALMENKELLDGAISASSDIHLSKLLSSEEATSKRESAMCNDQVETFKSQTKKRSTDHTHEIRKYIEANGNKIREVLTDLQQVDDDGY
eukprot:g2188.t1